MDPVMRRGDKIEDILLIVTPSHDGVHNAHSNKITNNVRHKMDPRKSSRF